MQIDRLDHLVLTVQNLQASCDFYARVLGMHVTTFGANRTAVTFGTQKINLHVYGQEFEPKALHPLPGSADLCFVTSTPLAEVIAHLEACGVPLLEGPVKRSGAMGTIVSVYIRDCDMNLIELCNYEQSTS
jgi:catechol 2,3-dioxygenase-like lactoylglutathione lyase family enzyme